MPGGRKRKEPFQEDPDPPGQGAASRSPPACPAAASPQAPGWEGGVAAPRPPAAPRGSRRSSPCAAGGCRRMHDAGSAEQSMNERSGFLPPPLPPPRCWRFLLHSSSFLNHPPRRNLQWAGGAEPLPAASAAARPGCQAPGPAPRGKPGGTSPVGPQHAAHTPLLCSAVLAQEAAHLTGAMLGITSPHRCRGGTPKAPLHQAAP